MPNTGEWKTIDMYKLGVKYTERVLLAAYDEAWTKDQDTVRNKLNNLLTQRSKSVCSNNIRSSHVNNKERFWTKSPGGADSGKYRTKKTIAELIEEYARKKFEIEGKVDRDPKTGSVYRYLDSLLKFRANFFLSYAKWCASNNKPLPTSPSMMKEKGGKDQARRDARCAPKYMKPHFTYFYKNLDNLLFMQGLDSILESLIAVRKFYQKGVNFAGSELLTSVEDNHNIVDFVLSLEGSILGKRPRKQVLPRTKKLRVQDSSPSCGSDLPGIERASLALGTAQDSITAPDKAPAPAPAPATAPATTPDQMTNLEKLSRLALLFRPATARQEPNATAQARDSVSNQGLPPVTSDVGESRDTKKRKVGDGKDYSSMVGYERPDSPY